MKIHRMHILLIIVIGLVLAALFHTLGWGETPQWFILIGTNVTSWILSAKTQQSKNYEK